MLKLQGERMQPTMRVLCPESIAISAGTLVAIARGGLHQRTCRFLVSVSLTLRSLRYNPSTLMHCIYTHLAVTCYAYAIQHPAVFTCVAHKTLTQNSSRPCYAYCAANCFRLVLIGLKGRSYRFQQTCSHHKGS